MSLFSIYFSLWKIRSIDLIQFTWQLSSSQTSLSPQWNVSNNSYTTPEKTNSKENLSTSVLNQRSNKPVVGTPRTSTPEPRKSMSPPVGQQSIRGFHHESVLSKVGSHADKRKPFYVSMTVLDLFMIGIWWCNSKKERYFCIWLS